MTDQDIEARRQRDLERYYRQTAERRAQGLCIKCGKRPPTPHRTWCEPCTAKKRPADRARHHRRTAERVALGLCPTCGKVNHAVTAVPAPGAEFQPHRQARIPNAATPGIFAGDHVCGRDEQSRYHPSVAGAKISAVATRSEEVTDAMTPCDQYCSRQRYARLRTGCSRTVSCLLTAGRPPPFPTAYRHRRSNSGAPRRQVERFVARAMHSPTLRPPTTAHSDVQPPEKSVSVSKHCTIQPLQNIV